MAAPFAAPKTAFNANVTGHSNVAFANSTSKTSDGEEPLASS